MDKYSGGCWILYQFSKVIVVSSDIGLMTPAASDSLAMFTISGMSSLLLRGP